MTLDSCRNVFDAIILLQHYFDVANKITSINSILFIRSNYKFMTVRF